MELFKKQVPQTLLASVGNSRSSYFVNSVFAFYEHPACWEKQAFINSLDSRLTDKCWKRYAIQMWYLERQFHWEGPKHFGRA